MNSMPNSLQTPPPPNQTRLGLLAVSVSVNAGLVIWIVTGDPAAAVEVSGWVLAAFTAVGPEQG